MSVRTKKKYNNNNIYNRVTYYFQKQKLSKYRFTRQKTNFCDGRFHFFSKRLHNGCYVMVLHFKVISNITLLHQNIIYPLLL